MLTPLAIAKFLQWIAIAKQYSSQTQEQYQRYLQYFKEFLDSNKIKEVEEINLDLINDYRYLLSKKNVEKDTQNYHLIIIRSFLKFLIKNEIKVLDPIRIDLARKKDRQVSFLEPKEINKMLEICGNKTIIALRDQAIIEMLYSTGLRISELCSLDVSNINLQSKEFSVRGKGKKIRVVFLTEKSSQILNSYLKKRKDNYTPLFLNFSKRKKNENFEILDKNGELKRLSRNYITSKIKKIARLAGITKPVSAHTLRHSFATTLLQAGADIRSVQEMLGHSSITTTQVYTHVTNKKLKEIHQKFHQDKE